MIPADVARYLCAFRKDAVEVTLSNGQLYKRNTAGEWEHVGAGDPALFTDVEIQRIKTHGDAFAWMREQRVVWVNFVVDNRDNRTGLGHPPLVQS